MEQAHQAATDPRQMTVAVDDSGMIIGGPFAGKPLVDVPNVGRAIEGVKAFEIARDRRHRRRGALGGPAGVFLPQLALDPLAAVILLPAAAISPGVPGADTVGRGLCPRPFTDQ